MKEYNTYLFDWDGCLAKTLDVWMSVYKDVYKEYGYDLSMEEVISTSWGNCELGPKNVGMNNYEEVWAQISDRVSIQSQQVPLFNYAKELLIELKRQDNKIAIVTSSQKKIIKPALAFHGLDVIIDVLVTEEDVSNPKPDPEIVNKAIKSLDGSKETSVIIGDTSKDINAGNAAGIDSILVLHPSNEQFYDFSKLRQLDSTYQIENLQDIFNG